MWSSSVQTGAELSIAGISVKNLAQEFGTPTFFIDEADFYARAAAWNVALKESFGSNAGTVYYALKNHLVQMPERFITQLKPLFVPKLPVGLKMLESASMSVPEANFPSL